MGRLDKGCGRRKAPPSLFLWNWCLGIAWFLRHDRHHSAEPREGEWETETMRDRDSERQRQWETETVRGRDSERQRKLETGRERQWEWEWERDRDRGIETVRERYRVSECEEKTTKSQQVDLKNWQKLSRLVDNDPSLNRVEKNKNKKTKSLFFQKKSFQQKK